MRTTSARPDFDLNKGSRRTVVGYVVVNNTDEMTFGPNGLAEAHCCCGPAKSYIITANCNMGTKDLYTLVLSIGSTMQSDVVVGDNTTGGVVAGRIWWITV